MDENPASVADVGKPASAEAVQGPDSDEKQDTSAATAPQVDVGATAEAENDAKRRKIDTDNQEVAASVVEKNSSTQPAVGTSEGKNVDERLPLVKVRVLMTCLFTP